MTGPLDWTLGEVAAATGGVAVGDPLMPVRSVTTDSRAVESGSLFVAIVGATHDGHEYVRDAMTAGSVAAVVRAGTHPDLTPRVEVEETCVALRDLAAHRRTELDLPVIAVTGSTGKTSTKDLLAAAVPGSWASPRSYNNEIGVPLTVLSTPDTAKALIVEAGSRGSGHLTWLLPAIQPTVAVITNLGVVHFETFGSRDAVADGKWELVAGLPGEGVAVLPDDEPRLRRPHPGPTITFGTSPEALFRVTSLVTDERGRPSFTIRGRGETFPVKLRMAGAHHALNAAAALAAATAVGVDPATAVSGLERAEASPWRMEVVPGRFTVVNDSYNANPTSTAAALRTVASMPGRSIAVLGEMAELGALAADEHRAAGRLAAELSFALVVTVGEDHGLAAAAGGVNVPDADAACTLVVDEVEDGDVVLVKASRSVGLEELARQLVEEAVS